MTVGEITRSSEWGRATRLRSREGEVFNPLKPLSTSETYPTGLMRCIEDNTFGPPIPLNSSASSVSALSVLCDPRLSPLHCQFEIFS